MPTRFRGPFDPSSAELFRLSRTKVDLYMQCTRCFYLDRRHGISAPGSPPFSLNNKVDEQLKREFDHYRTIQQPHPYMVDHGIDAVPFRHEKLEAWRDARRRGITYLLPNTPLVITGGIDDVWSRNDGTLHIVDYKATSKNSPVSLDADWQIAYKRQVEIYQWLFRKNGFPVSDTAYFVYCNANSTKDSFNNSLDFSVTILEHQGNTSWIEPALSNLYEVLCSSELPPAGEKCEHCAYRAQAARLESW